VASIKGCHLSKIPKDEGSSGSTGRQAAVTTDEHEWRVSLLHEDMQNLLPGGDVESFFIPPFSIINHDFILKTFHFTLPYIIFLIK